MTSGELGRELSSEDSMPKQLKAGDRVAWQSNGGGRVGRVERKLTSPAKIKGHEVAASEDTPEFLVRSETSGKVAAHKPPALRKVQ
jgi:Hypervirulence associated proteins TUDOR domain